MCEDEPRNQQKQSLLGKEKPFYLRVAFLSTDPLFVSFSLCRFEYFTRYTI